MALAGTLAAASWLLVPVTGRTAAAPPAASASPPPYVAAAEYFGDGSPVNMWSSDLSGAPQAFSRMRRDGFNTVGLVVPWGEFEPDIAPARYDAASFRRLDRLIGDASRLGMGVILRLSYQWDNDPADDPADSTRFAELWANQSVYSAWLGYLATVHRNVASFHNVREAYLSWEDLWEPIFEAQEAASPLEELAVAASTGYRSWLKSTDSLAQVSTDYGAQFTAWTQVPAPPADQPSFDLMYQYEDWALVHRLFIPAARRFPGLSMETRVDVDPIYSGTQAVGSYAHSAQYQLPGTSVTGMYFSPYMGDPAPTHLETASDAISALQSVLSKMSGQVGGRHLFIYEYEIESNSPQVATDPALTAGQIPAFVAQSEPLLHQYTTGYALWTYQDYVQSPVFNQSFALGAAGWNLSHGARAVPESAARSYARLPAGGRAVQILDGATVDGLLPATVSLQADAAKATTVDLQWGDGAAVPLHVGAGWHSYQVKLPASPVDTLSIRALGAASITDVQMYWYTQLGDIHGAAGQPEVGAAPLKTLNDDLTGAANPPS